MIELPLNVARYKHMLERLLVPVGIWKGGWLLYPGRRFRLKPIKARQILDFYHDIIWKPDASERLLLECWGDFSPLWRILGRAPA